MTQKSQGFFFYFFLILENKIPKVVIGCQDPNPQVGGKSIEKLKKIIERYKSRLS